MMPMQPKHFCSIVLLFLMISFFSTGCGEKKEASKAPVVIKKIEVQSKTTPSTTADSSQKDATTKTADPTVGDEAVTGVAVRVYDPAKRINPFTPLFGGNKSDVDSDKSKKRKKRIPQTPLERIGLDQLKLVAIIRASTGNRALVEDTVGKGYIIKNGTYIGLNSGMVTQINADSVIIEEELENLKGELVLQNTEIKLQKPAGE
jgi:type IV pilus assembly protein PilP